MISFDIEKLFLRYRYHFASVLVVMILSAGAILFIKKNFLAPAKIEVLGTTTEKGESVQLTAEIAGEVVKPGVYKVNSDARIDDLLHSAGGLTTNADLEWVGKYLNRAAKVTDGQKVYIPMVNKQTGTTSAKTDSGIKMDQSVLGVVSAPFVNINTASLAQLDTLPGIGPVYGQKIIDQRPYSNTEELLSKGVLKKSVYDKIKDRVTVY